MNLLHGMLCSSRRWVTVVRDYMIPWALDGIALGDQTLEIGPGYGATTDVLVDRTRVLTALELDPRLVMRLNRRFGDRVRIVRGDGTAMPFADASFDAVTCFTMLHHVPAPNLQDRLFAEAFRVLRPGGTFVGSDSMTSLGFRLLHLRDTMVMVDPATLPARLEAAGFVDASTASYEDRAFRFSARKLADLENQCG